jgi:RimJ/RimL family protein N-acetyltransferase
MGRIPNFHQNSVWKTDKGFVMTVVVVSILTRVQKPDILRHLAELSADDLWFRFGSPVRQSALENYVNGIDFTSDRALGIYDPELKLAGFTHVGIEPAKRCAELGISVSAGYRRRGYAEAMLRQALRHAAHLDLDQVYVYFRTANVPMMRLARKAGFDIAIHGSEAVASKQVEKTPPGKQWWADAAQSIATCVTRFKIPGAAFRRMRARYWLRLPLEIAPQRVDCSKRR